MCIITVIRIAGGKRRLRDMNHNAVYYGWVKKKTENCGSILDAGCGDGALISYLDDGKRKLTGIDIYGPCIEKAENNVHTGNARFICGSFEDFDSERKYDAVIFSASLHHMNMENAIGKARDLLNENGKIVIVGLAKPSKISDYIIEGLRVLPCALLSKILGMKSSEESGIPVSYVLPKMNEVRNMAHTLLPGAEIKQGLFYRYLLTWKKPYFGGETDK